MIFGTSNTERGRINTGGEWGFGRVASVGYKADVQGTVRSSAGFDATGWSFRALNTAGDGGGGIVAPNGAAAGLRVSSDGGPLYLMAGGVDRMVLNAAGHVGIPLASGKLSVGAAAGSGSGQLFVYKSGAANVTMETSDDGVSLGVGTNRSGLTNAWGAPTGNFFMMAPNAQPMVFGTSATPAITISATGAVGVGTVAPHTAPTSAFSAGNGSGANIYIGSGTTNSYLDQAILHFRSAGGVEIANVADTGIFNIVNPGKLYIAGVPVKWESAETALLSTALQSLNFAHPYSRAPDIFQIVLRCKTGEFGYAVGTEIDITSDCNSGTSGIAVYGYPSSIGFVQGLSGANTMPIRRPDTGAPGYVTAANWRLVAKGLWL
jgi:hypothetical protein